MDIDYAIRKDKPTIIDTDTTTEKTLYEQWERSNRLSLMFIKTKIFYGIRDSVDQHDNVKTLLKVIDEQFVTSISDYVVYLQESDYNIKAENDLETFSQAISCKESNLWYDAMKDEMNSMASNGVWNLVELPDGAKSIGYKWVFKKKKDSLGNIERYKARLVAKGFTQKEGIDYKETFSLYLRKILFVTL
ncbi:hypothetical protein AAG906_006759 [Vitis piasezkii]